ncbi:hypothetical protein TNCV_4288191 [Trichonephila clavipes]|nr:hypothetical protein TNCV_4288191 [Trichonephila clavipes]
MAIKFDLMTLGLRAHNHPIDQGCPTRGPPVLSGVTDATKSAVRGSVGKYATRTVNFLQLNINGTQKKCVELSDILNENNIQDLAFISADTQMILGDINARSPSWGCKILDSKGDKLVDLADDINLTILNTGENTYVSKTNDIASALDISAISYASANNAH